MTTSGHSHLPAWQVLAERDLPSHLHMALDEVLLERVADGRRPPTLRFWGWTEPALVLGSSQAAANELDLEAAARWGFTVSRRISGGGTMLAEPGRTITWSLYLPDHWLAGLSFRDSYGVLDGFAVSALRKLGVNAGYRPINDIVSPAGKIAGAAQARRRHAVLHHTTMAYSMQPGLLTELIRLGRPSLVARGVRSAEKAVSPLDTLTSASRAEVVAALTAESGGAPAGLLAEDLEEAGRRVEARFGRSEWIFRL